jgi:hypothetical protein
MLQHLQVRFLCHRLRYVIFRSVFLYIYLSIYLSTYLSIYLSIYLSFYLSIFLSFFSNVFCFTITYSKVSSSSSAHFSSSSAITQLLPSHPVSCSLSHSSSKTCSSIALGVVEAAQPHADHISDGISVDFNARKRSHTSLSVVVPSAKRVAFLLDTADVENKTRLEGVELTSKQLPSNALEALETDQNHMNAVASASSSSTSSSEAVASASSASSSEATKTFTEDSGQRESTSSKLSCCICQDVWALAHVLPCSRTYIELLINLVNSFAFVIL